MAAAEEERFKRLKHIGFARIRCASESGLPHASIDYCLKAARHPGLTMWMRWVTTTTRGRSSGNCLVSDWRGRITARPHGPAYHLVQSVNLLKDHLKTEPMFNRLRKKPLKFHWINHHATHNAARLFLLAFPGTHCFSRSMPRASGTRARWLWAKATRCASSRQCLTRIRGACSTWKSQSILVSSPATMNTKSWAWLPSGSRRMSSSSVKSCLRSRTARSVLILVGSVPPSPGRACSGRSF